MDRRNALRLIAGAAVAAGVGAAPAAGREIFGSHLMTERERELHMRRMREAGAEEERRLIREEHRIEMRRRAAERGETLAEPPREGRGRHGMRRDGGMGSDGMRRDGGGMGPDGMRRKGGGMGRGR
ncbi:MAG: hypothetical protein R6V44_12720 [Paracoccaceae bacterium]